MLLRRLTGPEKQFTAALALITFTGAILRFRDLGSVSMTADEVSALMRLQFPSFSEMIDGGVRIDGHPAFAQTLLWFWTGIFGESEWAVRIPFAIFGVASIWLSGLIARRWFGEITAIAVAGAMAFLKFPLMYSQLARPYAPGLFFVLLTAWSLGFFLEQKSAEKKHIFLFVIGAAGAAYSHYFSLLEAALLGIGGLFLAPKTNRVALLFACGFAIAAFLPYTGVFLDQLKMGGIGGPGGWLGEPDAGFVWHHLRFIANNSTALLLALLGIFAAGLIFFFRRPGKILVFVFLLWMLPLAIGYFYSVKRNPVLQDSVLLFGLPFLLMFVFAWLPSKEKTKFAPAIPFAISALFFIYSSAYKPYVLTDHFGRLKELVGLTLEWQDQNRPERVAVVYNVDLPYFVSYYYDRFGRTPANVLATINNGNDELAALRQLVKKAKAADKDYFIYAWSTKYSPQEVEDIIREKFPYLVRREYWFNSAFYVFTSRPDALYLNEAADELYRSCDYFDRAAGETDPAGWTAACGIQLRDSSAFKAIADSIARDSSATKDGKYYFRSAMTREHDIRLDSSCLYSSALLLQAGTILQNPDNTLHLFTMTRLLETGANAVLVIQFEREGKAWSWNGREFSSQVIESDTSGWQPVYFGMQIPKDVLPSDTIRVYCYSKNGKPLLIDNLCFRVKKGHTGIYGARPDFE